MYDWRKKEFMQDKVTDYLNRNPVDISQDPSYRRYRDQYLKIGQQINADTAKLVDQYAGGYDNTYAQNVGKQAYQKYVAQLNNIAPSFQSAAEAIYKGQGDQMLQQLSLAQNIWDREHQPVRSSYEDSSIYTTPGSRITAPELRDLGVKNPVQAVRYIQDGYMLDEASWEAYGDKELHDSYAAYVNDVIEYYKSEYGWW